MTQINYIKGMLMIIPRYDIEIKFSSFINLFGIKKFNDFDIENSLFYNSATSAMYEYLKSLELDSNSVIGVPLYSCSSVWQAVKDAGCKIKFLDIGLSSEGYSFDIATLDDLDVLIFINYFGFGFDIGLIKREYPNLIVVSDNTHKNIYFHKNDASDAQVYSFNFHKPIVAGQGGALILNKTSPYFEKAYTILKSNSKNIKRSSIKKDMVVFIKTFLKIFIYNPYLYFIVFSRLKDKESTFHPPVIDSKTNVTKIGILGKMILGNQLVSGINKMVKIQNYLKLPLNYRLKLTDEPFLSYFPIFLSSERDKKILLEEMRIMNLDIYLLWSNYYKNAKYYGLTTNLKFPYTEKMLREITFLPEQIFLDKNIGILNKLITRMK